MVLELKINAKIKVIKAEKSGILTNMDAGKIGMLSLKLGAGKINDKENY